MNILQYIKPTLITCLIIALFIGGCQYGKSRVKCPDITTTTEYIYDTTSYYIPNDVYHYSVKDTTIYDTIYDTLYHPVDTAAILRDYFAVRKYDRVFNDTNIVVNLTDYVTGNKLQPNHEFKYTWLQPQSVTHTTVDNSKHYNRYLYLGASVVFDGVQRPSLNVSYASPKLLASVGYNLELKAITMSYSLPIIRW